MAAALETSDWAAILRSQEPELVAVVVPEYSSMICKATFPLPLGPMERWDATAGSSCWWGDEIDNSSFEDEGESDILSAFLAPERVTTFTVRRSGWVVGLASEIKMVPG